jgi:hypothetical protein
MNGLAEIRPRPASPFQLRRLRLERHRRRDGPRAPVRRVLACRACGKDHEARVIPRPRRCCRRLPRRSSRQRGSPSRMRQSLRAGPRPFATPSRPARYLQRSTKQPAFLNPGKPDPDQSFSVVSFGSDRARSGTPEIAFIHERMRDRRHQPLPGPRRNDAARPVAAFAAIAGRRLGGRGRCQPAKFDAPAAGERNLAPIRSKGRSRS